MVNPESAVASKLDAFIEMVRIRDQALLEELWGDGKFFMVGSEAGEICRTRSELAAKLSTIFRHASTSSSTFRAGQWRSLAPSLGLLPRGRLHVARLTALNRAPSILPAASSSMSMTFGAGDSSSVRSRDDDPGSPLGVVHERIPAGRFGHTRLMSLVPEHNRRGSPTCQDVTAPR
jgi:hypothetical protein